jgi:hypothetical protein
MPDTFNARISEQKNAAVRPRGAAEGKEENAANRYTTL